MKTGMQEQDRGHKTGYKTKRCVEKKTGKRKEN